MRESLSILFLSDWQIASGLGDGHLADALLVRDVDGLPVIPGRALKGALREGAWRLGACREDLREAEIFFWGGRSTTAETITKTLAESNRPGCLRVSPGELDPSVRTALLRCPPQERENFVRDLTRRRMQTALTEDRQVKAQTLRTLECGIPGTVFVATLEIQAPDMDEQWIQHYFRAVCAAVKSMGGNRSRGFGACRLTLGNPEKLPKTIELPPQCPAWARCA